MLPRATPRGCVSRCASPPRAAGSECACTLGPPPVPSIALAQAFDYLVDFVFWLDIAISLRTTYVIKETNALELDPKVVMHRYTHGWMAAEVVGAFPLEVFVGGVSALNTPHGLREFNALRLVRWIMRVISARFKPGKTLTSPSKGTNVVAMRLVRAPR